METKEQKFSRVVEEFKRTIYMVCYMFSKDEDEVNDLFQEILIRLWQGFDSFEGKSDIRTWIYRVSLNFCLNYDKKQKRAGERVNLDMDIKPYEDNYEKSLQVTPIASCPEKYIGSDAALRAVKAIVACPSNVIRMSQSMEGLIETSTNLGIVRTLEDKIEISSLLRSAIDSSKDELAKRMRYIFEMAGADIRFEGAYPGWVPKPENPLIGMMSSIYERLFGEKIKVVATHGGLECAILGATYPNWDMVSIGPTVRYPHSPDERCLISSVDKIWKYLKVILEEIPEKNA